MQRLLLLAMLLLGLGCTQTTDTLLDPGISRELAQWRKLTYHNPRYKLHFDIPAQRTEAVEGPLISWVLLRFLHIHTWLWYLSFSVR